MILIRALARHALAYPRAAHTLLFAAIMLVGATGLRTLITTFGHWGFAAIMVGLFGFAFWLDRKPSGDQPVDH